MLTKNQIDLVQQSFKQVAPIAPQAAEIFYARLFELDPELKYLFKSNLKSQGQKLMKTLGVAVSGLNDLDKTVPVLQALAERHMDYGVRASDYTTVGNALLYTLKQGLGDEFTDEMRQAWIEVFRLVATTMKQHVYR